MTDDEMCNTFVDSLTLLRLNDTGLTADNDMTIAVPSGT
jgi:hypothetical protein